MAKYELVRDGIDSISVSENTVNFDTNLGFVGQSKTDYGQQIAQNFLLLLENFASVGGVGNAPSRPLRGQLWFDVDNTTLMFNKTAVDGEFTAANWVPVGTAIDLNSVLDGMLDGNEVFDIDLFGGFNNVSLLLGDDLFNVLEDLDTAITLAAGGGATIFTDLTDTPVDYVGQNGKMLQVSGTSLVFVDPPAPPGGIPALNDLSDVSVPSPSQNEVLTWITSEWVSVLPAASQTELVEDLTPQLGGALEIDGKIIKNTTSGNIVIDNQVTGGLVIIQAEDTGWVIIDGRRWPNTVPGGDAGFVLATDVAGILSWVPRTADDFLSLTDTPSTYAGQNGKFLTVNEGTGEIQFSTGTAVPSDLGDLGDVTLEPTPANNEVLAFNGAGSWINQTASEAGLATTGDLSGLQTEVDNIEASLGPFVTSSGTFSATALNALDNITGLTGGSDLVDALTQLDSAISAASGGTIVTWNHPLSFGDFSSFSFTDVEDEANPGNFDTLTIKMGTVSDVSGNSRKFVDFPFNFGIRVLMVQGTYKGASGAFEDPITIELPSTNGFWVWNGQNASEDIWWLAVGQD